MGSFGERTLAGLGATPNPVKSSIANALIIHDVIVSGTELLNTATPLELQMKRKWNEIIDCISKTSGMSDQWCFHSILVERSCLIKSK